MTDGEPNDPQLATDYAHSADAHETERRRDRRSGDLSDSLLEHFFGYRVQSARTEREHAQLVNADDYERRLREVWEDYSAESEFRPGDLVQWKSQLRNAPYPLYGAPAVVVRLLQPSEFQDRQGKPLPEPVDMVVGVLIEEGRFELFTVSRFRFLPWLI